MSSDRVAELLRDLVAIESVNPAYTGGSGEAAVADYVERWARQLDLDSERQPVFPGRDNVIVRLDIDPDAPTLLFESHMDTVSIAPGTLAGFEPTIRDGKMFGRGACDTKGSMAAMMTAIEHLVSNRDRLTCNIEFLAAVDEEARGSGALTYAKQRPRIDAAIVGEPTELRIVNGHKGVVRGSISVHGRAAHTSVADEGINAIDGMADVIAALHSIAIQLPGGLTGGSLTVSLIEGGSGINIVPARCTIRYDRRTVPGETVAIVVAEIDDALEPVRARRQDVRIERPVPDLDVAPLDTAIDSRIVRAAIAAATNIGQNPEPTLVPYGSDASYLSGTGGTPCIVYGPGSIVDAHGADEFVRLDELEIAARFYREIAIAFGREGERT